MSEVQINLRAPEPLKNLMFSLAAEIELRRRAFTGDYSRGRGMINSYTCIADFVMRHGRAFGPETVSPRLRGSGEAKQCFRNALCLASRYKDLTYVEGFAMGIIPVNHAWCVTRQGEVIEPTWPGDFKPGSYVGVLFKTEFARAIVGSRARRYGLLNRWEDDWPVFRAPQKDWQVPLQVGLETCNMILRRDVA